MPASFTRPSFIAQDDWERATEAQQQDWHSYAKNLAELVEDPRFRSVVGRWIDEFCGVFSATLDIAECAAVGHVAVMTLREGARQPGIRIMQHLQAVAPKMWMRAMQEMKNARTRALSGPQEPGE